LSKATRLNIGHIVPITGPDARTSLSHPGVQDGWPALPERHNTEVPMVGCDSVTLEMIIVPMIEHGAAPLLVPLRSESTRPDLDTASCLGPTRWVGWRELGQEWPSRRTCNLDSYFKSISGANMPLFSVEEVG
jgi:hypothetical protein